jgi:hypothetical protein
VFTFNRNSRSPSTEISVHVEPKWVFTIDRNTHTQLGASSMWAAIRFREIDFPRDFNMTKSFAQ